MTANIEAVVCERCGELTSSFKPHLRSIMVLQRAPQEGHVSVLAELESIPLEVAANWVRHHYHQSCVRKVGHCRRCNGILTTWQAKWCCHCKQDWH
jgi:hypothetical protein